SAGTEAVALPEGSAPSTMIGLVDSSPASPQLLALLPEARPLPQLGGAAVGAIAALAGSADIARARAAAAARRLPLTVLEPGLLRAPGLGGRPAPLLSLTATEVSGGAAPRDLRPPAALLTTTGWDTPELLARARAAIAALRAARLGGTWWAPDPGA